MQQMLSVFFIALVKIQFFEQVTDYMGWIWSAVICGAMNIVIFFACGPVNVGM